MFRSDVRLPLSSQVEWNQASTLPFRCAKWYKGLAMAVLTPRQRTIQRLVRRGMTSRGIAEHLGISQRTVEVHRANIARRLSSVTENAPLDHPAVQKALKRLSHRVAVLAMELKQIRGTR